MLIYTHIFHCVDMYILEMKTKHKHPGTFLTCISHGHVVTAHVSNFTVLTMALPADIANMDDEEGGPCCGRGVERAYRQKDAGQIAPNFSNRIKRTF